MLATVRLSILLFITTLLFSCATTKISPEQVLQMQEREEKVIKKHFGRKLGPFEGIWLVKVESITKLTFFGTTPTHSFPELFEPPPVKQTVAIYKRGNAYIVQDLSTGKFLNRYVKEMKKSELEYVGTCTISLPLASFVGNFIFLSVDDDSLHYTCQKKRLLGDFYKAVTYTRIYPKDLKEHNNQY